MMKLYVTEYHQNISVASRCCILHVHLYMHWYMVMPHACLCCWQDWSSGPWLPYPDLGGYGMWPVNIVYVIRWSSRGSFKVIVLFNAVITSQEKFFSCLVWISRGKEKRNEKIWEKKGETGFQEKRRERNRKDSRHKKNKGKEKKREFLFSSNASTFSPFLFSSLPSIWMTDFNSLLFSLW